MSRTDLVHTRLARHNWVLAEKSGEKYLYRRGDHWIQLDPDGFGYHGYQDRRVSNGTHESIVARFGETPDPRTANALLARINAAILDLADVKESDPFGVEIREALELLTMYADDVFERARHE